MRCKRLIAIASTASAFFSSFPVCFIPSMDTSQISPSKYALTVRRVRLQMIYLLRKSLPQQLGSRRPEGQLESPLIQGTTPNYATGEFPNTDRLLSHTFQSKEASYFLFCILIKRPSASAPLPSRLPGLRSTCGPVR